MAHRTTATGSSDPGAGKGHTRWARFGKIPVGYKTVKVTGQGRLPGLKSTHTVRKVIYKPGGWVKVGSPEWKKINSFIGPHGHQASVPLQYKIGKINPSLRVVGSPDSVDRNKYIKQQERLVHNGLTPAQAQAQLGKPPPGINDVRPPGKGNGNNPANPKTTAHNDKVVSRQIGNPNVGQMTPMKDAVAQANLQFGAQIKDTKLAQAEGTAQHAQNLHDIQQWYGQIMGVNDAAQQANQAAVKHGVNQDQGNMLAALRAIGGSANASAGAVAAAGLNDQSLMQGLGDSQDAFSNSLKPMLEAQQSGQMSAQSALDSQAARSLQQQLSDLQGQRGDAIVTNQDAIRASNNALAQTWFGNRISKQQAIQAAVALAGSQRLQAQQITGQALSNTIAGQQAGIYPTTGNNGSSSSHVSWASMKPADRYSAITSAIKALGAHATPQKVAVMLHAEGQWAPVHTMTEIKTFFQ